MLSVDLPLSKVEGGFNITFSYQMDLLMLHGAGLSAQWNPDSVAIQVNMEPDGMAHVRLWPQHNPVDGYLHFFFDSEYFDQAAAFFRKLGYPVAQD